MPSEFGPDPEPGDLRVAIAPVLELQFGLFLLRKHRMDPEKWVPPWVVEFNARNAPLVERLVQFWVSPGLDEIHGSTYRECGELLVVGWETGTLFASSPNAFLDVLEHGLAKDFAMPSLESEPAEVVALIERRLALLRRDAALRSSLVSLVREAFELMLPYWDSAGQAGAERAARDLTARSRSGADLRALLPGNSFVHKDAHQAHILAARARNELVVVPLGLAGGGQFYWSFPGLVLVGAGTESAEREARRKERAERAANKLKVLSDPTRLAILFELLRPSHHAATVTELASQFGLSQPTVSVHIKMLREAGIARPERDGNQVHYQSDDATIRAFVGEALDDILRSNA